MRFVTNPHHQPGVPPNLTLANARYALRDIAQWPDYRATPLVDLAGFASSLGVAKVWLKDEGHRFGVQSFKPMGGGYAVSQLVARAVESETGVRPSVHELFEASSRGIGDRITVACATEGNHGRAVAWAARTFGCHAVVYMADNVTPKRATAIASYGARIVRSNGNHEDAMREMVRDAVPAGWHIISETKSASDERIAWDTLAGYGALMLEAFDQLRDEVPTHLFIQAGVGGLAAASIAMALQRWPDHPPRLIVVESDKADCVLRSVHAGERVAVTGHFDTMMLGLAAGEVSDFAWQFLSAGAYGCIAIDDAPAAAAMRRLARPIDGDPPVVVGESGVAGVAALAEAVGDADCRTAFGLNAASRILAVATEGATDEETYRAIVGAN